MRECYDFFRFLEKVFQSRKKFYRTIQGVDSLETENKFKTSQGKVVSHPSPMTIEIISKCRVVSFKFIFKEVTKVVTIGSKIMLLSKIIIQICISNP